MCRNWKLWIGLAAGAAVVALFAPGIGAVLPILLVAACPVMMLVMAGGMAGMTSNRQEGAPNGALPHDRHEVDSPPAEIGETAEPARR